MSPTIDIWESHPKLGENAGCICTFLIERETNLKDRKCLDKKLGSSTSDWTWAAHPKVTRKKPGHMSTFMARCVQFCHPSLRNSSKKKPLTTVAPQAATGTMQDLPAADVQTRKTSQVSEEDIEEDMLVTRLSSKCIMSETTSSEQGSAKSKHKSKKPDISETELKLLMDNFSMEELKRMLEDGVSAADFEQLKDKLRQSRNKRDQIDTTDNDLTSMRTSGEQKGKDDLMHYENEQPGGQAKDDPQALPTVDQLKASRDNGDISAADFKILQGNCDQYELKQKLDQNCISASDFEQLKDDLSRSENTRELKDLRETKVISASDFAKLTVDFEKSQVEGLLQSGRISESDSQKLQQDLMQSASTGSESDLQKLQQDLTQSENTSEDSDSQKLQQDMKKCENTSEEICPAFVKTI